MKNILNDKPNFKLHGRTHRSMVFVEDSSIKGKAVLDVGCGYGWTEVNFLSRGVEKIVGIEISEEDLKTVRKHIKDKRASFVVAGATKLPFKDNSFDTVVSWEVIEHIPKDTENIFFQEVHRVLKKNGTFYLSTPYHAFFSTYTDPAYWLTGHRHYTKEALTRYGKKNDFTVEKIHIFGGFWTVLALVNMYTSKWIFRRKRFFDTFFTKKDNEDYENDGGFYNIFVKYKKK